MITFRLVVKFQAQDRDGNNIIYYVKESLKARKADLLRFNAEAQDKIKAGYLASIEYIEYIQC